MYWGKIFDHPTARKFYVRESLNNWPWCAHYGRLTGYQALDHDAQFAENGGTPVQEPEINCFLKNSTNLGIPCI